MSKADTQRTTRARPRQTYRAARRNEARAMVREINTRCGYRAPISSLMRSAPDFCTRRPIAASVGAAAATDSFTPAERQAADLCDELVTLSMTEPTSAYDLLAHRAKVKRLEDELIRIERVINAERNNSRGVTAA